MTTGAGFFLARESHSVILAHAAVKTKPHITLALIAIALLGCDEAGTAGAEASDDAVQTVKRGVLEMDKSTTLGKAFDGHRYFTATVWTPSTDTAGRNIVEAGGTLNFAKITEKDIAISFGRIANESPEKAATDQTTLAQARTALANVRKRFKGAQIVFQFVINLDGTFEMRGAKINLVCNDNKVLSSPLDGKQPEQNLRDIYAGDLPILFTTLFIMNAN